MLVRCLREGCAGHPASGRAAARACPARERSQRCPGSAALHAGCAAAPARLCCSDVRVSRSFATATMSRIDGSRQRQPAQHRVHEPDHGDEDRHPGRIEEGQDGVSGQEGAHLLKIGQPRLAPGAGKARLDAATDHWAGQLGIEPRGCPGQQPPARKLEHAIDRDGEHRSDRQPQQRVDRAAREHPVEHLQHVNRAHQQEQIGGQD